MFDLQANVHAVKLQPPNPHNGQDGATAIWQAVKDLEANPQLAESIAGNSVEFVENILTTDNVQRCKATSLLFPWCEAPRFRGVSQIPISSTKRHPKRNLQTPA